MSYGNINSVQASSYGQKQLRTFSNGSACLKTRSALASSVSLKATQTSSPWRYSVPKKPVNFRLSNEHIAILTTYQAGHSLANTTEALEQILNALLSPSVEQKEASSSRASDLLPCRRRIEFEEKYLCVNRPPKAVELLSLEICNVCKAVNVGLEDRTKVDVPTEETFDRGREPVRDPNRKDMPKDMTYCPEGLWVLKDKCPKCRQRNYAVWYECQKQKYRQKGEQLAAVQRAGS
jgi:hypothetical protein